MAANAEAAANRNRLDHLLPQGYLEGFTGPSTDAPLCVFDRQGERWFETGTARVGAIKGFYDYSERSDPDQTADQAFARLEAQFPPVRRDLVENSFSNWRVHLDFLLHFAQMLRNKAITDMRTEIAKGAAWLSERHWCLRFDVNPTDPVITTDHPVVVDGRSSTLEEALPDPNTLVFFPVCWQACLIGSMARFDKETDAFHLDDLMRLRGIQLKLAQRFVFSPSRVAFGLAAVNATPF